MLKKSQKSENINFGTLLEEFYCELGYKGCAEATIATYKRILENFYKHIKETDFILDLEKLYSSHRDDQRLKTLIENYCAVEKQNKWESASINLFFSAMSSFLKYNCQRHKIFCDTRNFKNANPSTARKTTNANEDCQTPNLRRTRGISPLLSKKS